MKPIGVLLLVVLRIHCWLSLVIDGCGLVSQLNYLSNSNKDCDWLILKCAHFARKQYNVHQTREALLPNPHVPRREMKIWRWQSSFHELNRLEYLTKTNKAGKIKSQKNLSQYRSGIQTRSWFWFPWYDFSCFNFNWWIMNEFQKKWLFFNHSFHSHTCYILFFTCS